MCFKIDIRSFCGMNTRLAGNDKRKASCKKVGGAKKRGGHRTEDLFNDHFGISRPTTYRAEADSVISPENPRGAELIAQFPRLSSHRVSIKSGKNLQFTLGRIDEVTAAADPLAALSSRGLWEKYLAKSQSSNPADLLAYRMDDGWVLFEMSRVIDFIVDKCTWRKLDSGRFKGDFADTSRKGVSQYLTFEYRGTHKSQFLGANGNKGRKFIELLMANLPFTRAEDTR
jgi:hypothetical protein